MIEGQDYYAKSSKRADLLLARLLGLPFPDFAKEKSRYYVEGVCPEDKVFIKGFNDLYLARGLTAGARIHYLRFLEAFCSRVKKPFAKVTREDTIEFVRFIEQDYLSLIYGKKLSKATIRHYKTAMKYFFVKFYEGNKEVERDSRGIPMIVSWVKREKRDDVLKDSSDMLSPAEIRAMLEACDNPRDRAMISVLYEGALRASELLDMTNKSVKLDEYGALISVKGKTGQRTIRLINSVPDLALWLNHHPAKNEDTFNLWTAMRKRVPRDFESKNVKTHISFYTERLRIKGLQELVQKLKGRVGIKKRVHPHLFRHARLTDLAKKLTEQELKIFAGWTPDSRMAAQYVHLSGRDIDNSILRINGIVRATQEKESKELSPMTCPRCQEINPSTAKFCYKCSMVLDIKTAIELEEYKVKDDQTVKTMMERMTRMQSTMQDLFQELDQMRKTQKAAGK